MKPLFLELYGKTTLIFIYELYFVEFITVHLSILILVLFILY